jgi:transcriptional antiterminator NusG
MERQWFALQTLTGQENKVVKFLESERRLQGLEEEVGEVLMPTEKVVVVRQVRKRDKSAGPDAYRMESKKAEVTRKLYPGYVFVEAAVYDGARKINERVWSFLRGIQGVIGFVGGDPPAPMTATDVENLKASATAGAENKARPKVQYEPGDKVKITDGPFMSFSGIVQEVNPDQGKLNVLVAIFGREVQVELEYTQVERDESKPEEAPEAPAAEAPAP